MIPDVSVIIPVFNRERLVGRAVASLTRQTLYNIEIIVVDDGSTDGTAAAVARIDDQRVRLVIHPENRGIPAARNSGLAEARGRYIAWLDSDDVARPERLEIQCGFLNAHPSIAMIGAAARRIGPNGIPKFRLSRPPATHAEIVAKLLFRSAFQQSSVMGRAEVLREYPYRSEFDVCEDVDMFIRLTRDHPTANLRSVVIDRYLHAGQTVRQESAKIIEKKKALLSDLLRRLGIDAADEELERHVLLANIKRTRVDREFLVWGEQWLARIAAANARTRLYDSDALTAAADRVWQRALSNGPANYRAGLYRRRVLAGADRAMSMVRSIPERARVAELRFNAERHAAPKWILKGVAAALMISAGWFGRGQIDTLSTTLPELSREADEARDVFAASYPKPRGASVADYEMLAQKNQLSAIVIPNGWRIVSSAMVRTKLGRTLDVSARAADGTQLTILISRNARRNDDRPVITDGDDEKLASWSRGYSDYAIAAQASLPRMRQLTRELYDSRTIG
jgi:glycosyltransferase involved in cell wall biosynthesis